MLFTILLLCSMLIKDTEMQTKVSQRHQMCGGECLSIKMLTYLDYINADLCCYMAVSKFTVL